MTRTALPTTIAVAHAHDGRDSMSKARSQAAKNKLRKESGTATKTNPELWERSKQQGRRSQRQRARVSNTLGMD